MVNLTGLLVHDWESEFAGLVTSLEVMSPLMFTIALVGEMVASHVTYKSIDEVFDKYGLLFVGVETVG